MIRCADALGIVRLLKLRARVCEWVVVLLISEIAMLYHTLEWCKQL